MNEIRHGVVAFAENERVEFDFCGRSDPAAASILMDWPTPRSTTVTDRAPPRAQIEQIHYRVIAIAGIFALLSIEKKLRILMQVFDRKLCPNPGPGPVNDL